MRAEGEAAGQSTEVKDLDMIAKVAKFQGKEESVGRTNRKKERRRKKTTLVKRTTEELGI